MYKNHSWKYDCNRELQIKIEHDLWFDCSQFQSRSLPSNMFLVSKYLPHLIYIAYIVKRGKAILPNLSIYKYLFEKIQ